MSSTQYSVIHYAPWDPVSLKSEDPIPSHPNVPRSGAHSPRRLGISCEHGLKCAPKNSVRRHRWVLVPFPIKRALPDGEEKRDNFLVYSFIYYKKKGEKLLLINEKRKRANNRLMKFLRVKVGSRLARRWGRVRGVTGGFEGCEKRNNAVLDGRYEGKRVRGSTTYTAIGDQSGLTP